MSVEEHAETRDLLPAYALGSLDTDEAADVSRHLATCVSCRSELDAFTRVVDALALAAPAATPSPKVRQRLLAAAAADRANSVNRVPPAARNAVAGSLTPPRRGQPARSLSRRPAWAALALIALVAVALGAIIWAAARPSGGRSIVLSPSSDIAPQASGELRFESGAATLEVKGLPLLTAEEQYQLWLVQDGDRDSGAVFSVNDNGWAEVPVETARSPGDSLSDYTDLWISIEPAGGSPDPTGEWVLEWGSE